MILTMVLSGSGTTSDGSMLTLASLSISPTGVSECGVDDCAVAAPGVHPVCGLKECIVLPTEVEQVHCTHGGCYHGCCQRMHPQGTL